MKHTKPKEQTYKWALPVVIVVAVIVMAGAGSWLLWGNSNNSVQTSNTLVAEQVDTTASVPQTFAKTQYTEQEKNYLEQQVGVSINEEGTMEIDVGAVLQKQQEFPVTRQQAENHMLQALGGQADSISASLRTYEGKTYWAVQAEKDGQSHYIWLDAETGEEFINQ